MNTDLLYLKIKADFESKISFLSDKPEETIDSTLKACWLAAFGIQRSAEEALKHELPELSEMQQQRFYQLLEKRLNNTPLAHITGRQSFMGIELLSDQRALIPRKETEILGKKALELSFEISKKKPTAQVMDICCGAGNLGLAVAYHNKNTLVNATDICENAVELAEENIRFLSLEKQVVVKQGDLFSAFETEKYFGKTDLIICNPPYISTGKVSKMTFEISAHEPLLAFDGGMFGLRIIQRLLEEAPKFLAPEGWLIFEVGVGQGEFISGLCKNNSSFCNVNSIADESGNTRVVMAQNSFAGQNLI